MRAQSHVDALTDELETLVSNRETQGWDKYWRDCMKFALPQDISYDQVLLGGISQVTNTIGYGMGPKTPTNSKGLYDQTSLWAIERLTAGLLSLKTPESTHWHELDVDDPFGYEMDLNEEAWSEKLTRYLFKVRANPRTGFWPTHKAAIRSTCAMGDGFFFIEEAFGNHRVPYTYEFVPLGECYRTVDSKGQSNRFFRYRNLTAEQIAKRWPKTASKRVLDDANDPKRRQQTHAIAHAVVPREDVERFNSIGVMSAPWMGVYFDPEDRIALEETGYWEMPYVGHSWSTMSNRPYSEGPMALALAEVKSLNEMSKNELISSQQAVRPPLATFGDDYTRLDLNAGAVNPGLINGDGRLLVQPIMTHSRPDFAQTVLETRRNNVREMLYLNLWQVLIENPQMTATEALLRAQEKGDLLGPVGISFNASLTQMTDREIGILARKGAFEEDSPLAIPDSLNDADIMPRFTAPLDRMRNMEEVLGSQRTIAGMMEVAAFKPEIMEKVDVDAYAEQLRKGNGAPATLFLSDDQMKENKQAQDQAQQLEQTLALAQAGGDAAQSMGAGVQALTGAMGGGGAPSAPGAAAPDLSGVAA